MVPDSPLVRRATVPLRCSTCWSSSISGRGERFLENPSKTATEMFLVLQYYREVSQLSRRTGRCLGPKRMNTSVLLNQVAAGDEAAVTELFGLHRERLRHMVALRMDDRLTSRFDPSDVVQEALVEANRRLPTYLNTRPLPFYPWLRKIAWEKLVHLHRRHIEAQRRSVRRETTGPELSSHSKVALVEQLAATSVRPSDDIVREELRTRVCAALDALSPNDREVITLKHLEEMSFKEAAAVIGITEQGVYSRYRRAVEKLHRLLKHDQD
jgi:RNA polymerase sigma-70 factor (ECF subfamily)